MLLKTEYESFWVPVGDAEFKIVEQDVSGLFFDCMTLDNQSKKPSLKRVLEAFRQSNITDWKNVKDKAGVDIPYSEKSKDLLTFDILIVLFNAVQEKSIVQEPDKKK